MAASAFRVLVNRLANGGNYGIAVSPEELYPVLDKHQTWISSHMGPDFGLVHTPTTMANYACASMMKHQGCRNFVQVFGRPSPRNAEYLMAFPIGASSLNAIDNDNINIWMNDVYNR